MADLLGALKSESHKKKSRPSGVRVNWEKAERFLKIRDHYTRDAIRAEFEENPRRDAVALDHYERFFATPVVDQKFSVVWKTANDEEVVVEGVVLAQFDPAKQGNLVEQVQRVLKNQGGKEVLLTA